MVPTTPCLAVESAGITQIGRSKIDEASCGDPVAVGTSNLQRWHQKVPTELVFVLALLLFFWQWWQSNVKGLDLGL